MSITSTGKLQLSCKAASTCYPVFLVLVSFQVVPSEEKPTKNAA